MIYNVHIVATPNDNGCCISFETEEAAERLAAWAREQGCWYVTTSRS